MNEIDELMLRNPMELSTEEVEKICKHYRAQRTNFQAAETIKAAKPKKGVTAEGMKLADELDL